MIVTLTLLSRSWFWMASNRFYPALVKRL